MDPTGAILDFLADSSRPGHAAARAWTLRAVGVAGVRLVQRVRQYFDRNFY